MKLEAEDLKRFCSGWEQLEEQDGFMAFHRFTPAEEQAILNHCPALLQKFIRWPAGVRLEMMTDAEAISFTYEALEQGAEQYTAPDLYADGVFLGQMKGFEGKLRHSLPEGKKRISLYFSGLCRNRIKEFILEGATCAEPITPRYRMICYGDSITQGADAAFPSLGYINGLARALDAAVWNKALAGGKFFPQLLAGAADWAPDLVTVAYGTNNWASSSCGREAFRADLAEFMKRLAERYPAAKVFVVTPIWRQDCFTKQSIVGSFEQLAAWIRAEAEQYGFITIDGLELMPQDCGFFQADGLHPNDIGHLWYGRELAKKISSYLY